MATKKIIYFLFGAALISINIQAQIKIFFEPEFNFFKPLGRIERSIANGALVHPVTLNLPVEPGVAAGLRINQHFLKFGYRLVQAGLNWRINTPDYYFQNYVGPYNSSKVSRVSLYSNQIHLGYSYLFKPRSFLPLFRLEEGDPNQKYLFRFSWFTLSGASLKWYYPTFYDSTMFSFSNSSGINIQDRIEYRFLRPRNFSLFLGGGIQFFHKNKERLKISLVYSQGLFRFYEFPITVTFDGKTEYQGLMSTRGSFIGLFVSYPILIWSDKRIRQKKGLFP